MGGEWWVVGGGSCCPFWPNSYQEKLTFSFGCLAPTQNMAAFFKVNLEKCHISITRGAMVLVLSDIPRL